MHNGLFFSVFSCDSCRGNRKILHVHVSNLPTPSVLSNVPHIVAIAINHLGRGGAKPKNRLDPPQKKDCFPLSSGEWTTGTYYKICGMVAKFQVPFMGGITQFWVPFFGGGRPVIIWGRGCKTKKKTFEPSAEKNTVVHFFGGGGWY